MKKLFKNPITGALMLISVCSITSCAPPGGGCVSFVYSEQHGQVEFWSSFGAAYTSILDNVVNGIQRDYQNGKDKYNEYGHNLNIKHVDHGSYDKIKTDVMSGIVNGDYPNVMVGYPDHFAEYIGNNIIVPLDYYMDLYKEQTGTNLYDEYYSAYMTENMNLDIDCAGNKVLTGLPFNKSTELMGYNGVFVDYCVDYCANNPDVEVNGVKASNWDLGNVPETWQEWAIKGVYYKYILDTLTLHHSGDTVVQQGALVYGNQNFEGTASDFEIVRVDPEASIKAEGIYKPAYATHNGKPVLLDFQQVEYNQTRVISWDATDNMFITLVRQWGGEYTKLPDSEKTKLPYYRNGHIRFNSTENNNRAKTIECLKYFTNLNLKGIFGVPTQLGGTYSSEAFESNNVMFMLCSSGGLSYNTAKWTNRFRVAHMPYYKEGNVIRKYVISQGANLAMTNRTDDLGQGCCDDSFRFMVELSTGQHQLDWCLQTGYYPASRSVANSEEYLNFLNEVEIETAKGTPEKAYQDANGNPSGTKVAYREGSQINQDYYMPPEPGQTNHYADDGVEWHKFVDDAFIHSSNIRLNVQRIFINAFGLTAADAAKDSSYQTILDEVCGFFRNDSNVIVD